MLALSDRLTVPQVFVNDTHIGGADDLLNLLKIWDEDLGESYSSFYDNSPDPTDPRLAISSSVVTEHSSPPPVREDQTIPLPDSTPTTVLDITELLKTILPRNDLPYKFTSYRNVFTGSQATTAFQTHFAISNRNEAEDFDTNELFFRLACDATPAVLNSYRLWSERVDPDSMRILKQLKKMLSNIVSAHTDGEGKVNYRQAATSKDFPTFEEAVCELQGVDYRGMVYNTKLAFSINMYNLMITYAFVKLGIPQSSVERNSFYNKVKFQIGRDVFSFSDLEHGVLRGNRKAPYSVSPQFRKNDPRIDLAMGKVDCRIHFALNCGAKSCPPVKNFTKEGVEEELRIVSQAFCEGDEQVRIDVESKTVYLSRIFGWYKEDFGKSNSDVLKTVFHFLRGGKQEQLRQLLLQIPGSLKVRYNGYDWSTDANDSVPFASDNLKANVFRSF
eukprot:scaffold374_cov124-Cylindrotheca_fusiformis.AAC.8